MPAAEYPALMTFAQVGSYLGRSWDWVDDWARSGDCPLNVREIGRVRFIAKAELDAWLATGAAA